MDANPWGFGGEQKVSAVKVERRLRPKEWAGERLKLGRGTLDQLSRNVLILLAPLLRTCTVDENELLV